MNHSSNHTGRYPRSLEEAFGPYTGKKFAEHDDPMPAADRIVVITCLIGFAALGVFALVGWL